MVHIRLLILRQNNGTNHLKITKHQLTTLFVWLQDVFYFHEDKFIYNEENNDLFRNYHDKPVIPDKEMKKIFLLHKSIYFL